MDIIASNINIKDITETLKGLQNMCNSVQILYEAYAKGKLEKVRGIGDKSIEMIGHSLEQYLDKCACGGDT